MSISALQFKILSWCLILQPTTFIRSLKGAAVLSLISFFGAILLLFSILINCGGHLIVHGLPAADKIRLWPASNQDLLGNAAIFILLYSIQAGGGLILSNLKDSSDYGMNKTVGITFVIAFTLELMIGLSGYLYFLDDTPGDILTGFSATDPCAIVGRFGVLLLVVPGYMMMVNPCRMSMIQLLFDKNEALQEATYSQFAGVTTAINVCALAFAVLVQDLSAVFAIDGSLITPFVAFILPGIFTIAIRAKAEDMKDLVPVFSKGQFDMYMVLVFGLGCLCVFGGQTITQYL
jgi:amino acid permease